MKIVPYGNLNAEVNIGTKDIGFIKNGQRVKVRLIHSHLPNMGN